MNKPSLPYFFDALSSVPRPNSILVRVFAFTITVLTIASTVVLGAEKLVDMTQKMNSKSTLTAARQEFKGNLADSSRERTGVLAATSPTQVTGTIFFNIPASFNKPVTVKNGINVEGDVVLNSDLIFRNGNLDLGEGSLTATRINSTSVTTGTITASNIIYSLTVGDGLSITEGQNPQITNVGVTKIQDKTGALTFTAGGGMSIDGLTFTNNDRGSAQNIFKKFLVSGQDTITSGSNDDSFTFVAGDGMVLTTDSTNKKLTIGSTSGFVTEATGWAKTGTSVFLSTTSDNVGIGTTAPTSKLHVVGASLFAGSMTLSSGSSILPAVSGGSDLGSSSNPFNNIYVNTINTNGALSSTGQAIFTYEPLSTAFDESTVMINPTTASANVNLLGIGVGGNQRFTIDAEGDLTVGYSGSVSVPTSSNPFNVYGHGTTLISSIDSSGSGYFAGNVGIGTTSPSGSFEVRGTGSSASISTSNVFSGNYLTTDGRGQLGLYTTDTMAADIGGMMVLGGDDGGSSSRSFAGIAGRKENGTSTNRAGYLQFLVRTNTGAKDLTEYMRISSLGNVGIGTTAPGAKLDIITGTAFADGIPDVSINDGFYNFNIGYDSQSRGTNYLSIYKNASTTILKDSSSGFLFQTGTASPVTRFSIGSSGNVVMGVSGGNLGIGTDSPLAKLDVAGTAWLRGSTASSGGVYVNSSGNVGIGTTAPGAKLALADSGSFSLTMTAAGAYTTTISNNASSNNPFKLNTYRGEFLEVQNNNEFRFGPTTSGTTPYLTFYASNAEKMRIDTSGNVGIGTTAPSTKLDINGDITVNGQDIYFTSGYVGNRISYTGSGYDFYGSGNQGAFIANNTGSSYFNGSVGIGTTAPTNKLEISNSTSFTGLSVSVSNGSALQYAGIAFKNLAASSQKTTAELRSTYNPGSLEFWVEAGPNGTLTERMRIDGSGNIGIGTTAPTATLDVTSTQSTGTAFKITGNSITTGTGLSMTSSSLTSGSLASLSSTSTALTSGSLMSLDWSPGSATTATGDLFSLNIGANGIAGNLFNLKDNGSSIFSVSQSAITANVPVAFNAPGDVSIAYDINFTNPTASFIKSQAPMTIQAGETFGSSDLTFKTYNNGSVVVDSGVTTGTAIDLTTSTLTTGYGFNAQFDGLTTGKGLFVNSASTAFTGDLFNITLSGSTAANTGSLLVLENQGTLNTNTSLYLKHYATGTGNLAMRVDDVSGDTTPFVIDGGGNVGIGITAPSTKLEVVDSSTDLQMRIGSTGVTGLDPNFRWTGRNAANTTNRHADIQLDADAGVFNIMAPSTVSPTVNAISILTGGNVGIGTTAPAATLQVVGSARIASTYIDTNRLDGPGLVTFSGISAFYGSLNMGNRNGINWRSSTWANAADTSLSNTAAGTLEINTGTAGQLGTLIVGNVGIGTTAPSYRLDIKSPSISTNILRLSNSTGTAVFTAVENSSAQVNFNITDGGQNNFDLGGAAGIGLNVHNATPINIHTGAAQGSSTFTVGSAKMVISVGNVGIGTTNPGYILDVQHATSKINSKNGYLTNGADYAEYMENEGVIPAHSLVGFNPETGKVRKYQDGDQFIGIVSTGIGFVGNGNKDIEKDKNYTLVGLVGQLDYDKDQVTVRNGHAYTKDNKVIGQVLSNKKILLKGSVNDETTNTLSVKIDALMKEISDLKAQGTQPVARESAVLATSSAVLGAADLILSQAQDDVLNDKNATLSSLLVSEKSTLNDLGVTGKITAGLLSIVGLDDNGESSINTLAGPLKLQSLALGGVDIMGGKVTIDTKGNIKAKKLNIDDTDAEDASIGEGTLLNGKTKVVISTKSVTGKSRIFITPETVIVTPIAVTGKVENESFTVEVASPATKDVKFSWMIVN